MILEQSIMYDEDELMDQCLQIFDENADEVLLTEDFSQLNLRTLNLLVARNFKVEREIRVFEAVERWSEAECTRRELSPEPLNKRKVLGEALYEVRMPLMSADEFANGPAKSGILSNDEAFSVYHSLFVKGGQETKFSGKVNTMSTKMK